jgi:hypothetical protein
MKESKTAPESKALESEVTVAEPKKNENILSFFGADKKNKVHSFLVPATENGCAKVSFKSAFNKATDRMGIVVTFGDTGKESVIWGSTNKLGRVFMTKPDTREAKETNEPTSL